jgi:hypothetical protein
MAPGRFDFDQITAAAAAGYECSREDVVLTVFSRLANDWEAVQMSSGPLSRQPFVWSSQNGLLKRHNATQLTYTVGRKTLCYKLQRLEAITRGKRLSACLPLTTYRSDALADIIIVTAVPAEVLLCHAVIKKLPAFST